MMDPQNEVKVGVEMTPNPDSLKFVVNRDILPFGSVYFKDRAMAEGSSLAEELFKIDALSEILIGTHFVTLTKKSTEPWEPLIEGIFHTLKGKLEGGGEFIRQDLMPKPSGQNADEISRKIMEVLDTEIRPAVARDGGDIVFGGYEEGVVRLQLQGACSSCPSSMMTLKMGVENRLKQLIPEIREVIQV